MNLVLHRLPSTGPVTHGILDVGGFYRLHTLEDQVREIPGQPVATWKIHGQTAIPAGTYALRMRFSARFQRWLPAIYDVPGFTHILIHAGNVIDDTEGCILVGLRAHPRQISRSIPALKQLIATLTQGTGPHTITIVNAANVLAA
jgi:hypothetical protein